MQASADDALYASEDVASADATDPEPPLYGGRPDHRNSDEMESVTGTPQESCYSEVPENGGAQLNFRTGSTVAQDLPGWQPRLTHRIPQCQRKPHGLRLIEQDLGLVHLKQPPPPTIAALRENLNPGENG